LQRGEQKGKDAFSERAATLRPQIGHAADMRSVYHGDRRGVREGMASRKLAALVLAVFGPWGIGHFHLGWRARGVFWLALAGIAVVGLGALLPTLGRHVGWNAAVVLPFATPAVVWGVSLVDLSRKNERGRTPVWQTALFFALGVFVPIAASSFLRGTFIDAFVVPTRSMQPTVLAGDEIIASRRDREPSYGEVVVLSSPEQPGQTLVKRVVAMPDDILEMRSGHLFINGWAVPSCPLGPVILDDATGTLEVEFLGDASYLVFYDAGRPVPQHVGPLYAADDGVLVLGDDRNASADSRTWHGGIDGNVPFGALRGRALFVVLRRSALDERHVGIDLARPSLPSSLAHLEPALDGCLASRPPAMPPRSIRQRSK